MPRLGKSLAVGYSDLFAIFFSLEIRKMKTKTKTSGNILQAISKVEIFKIRALTVFKSCLVSCTRDFLQV